VLVLISIFTQFLIFEDRFSDNFEALDTDNRLGMVWHMKHHRLSVLLTFLIFFLVSSVAPCLAHHMAVVVDKDNMVGNVTSVHLAKIFRWEIKKWPDGKEAVLVLHTVSSGEKSTLERLLKLSDRDLQAFIATHKNSLKMVATDAEVIDLVGSTPGAVGLVDVHSINGSINVVKVDGKLPAEAGYLPH